MRAKVAPVPVALKKHCFPLGKVVTISKSKTPHCGVPFLDLRFAARHYVPPEELCGPGIYGVFFGLPGKVRRLVYVGSYRGRKANPFSGNVAADRWWTHAASLTMRGDRISIARRTATWAAGLRPSHAFQALARKPALRRDRGCSAGLNRVIFAHDNWRHFKSACPRNLLNMFEIIYLRVAPSAAATGCATSMALGVRRKMNRLSRWLRCVETTLIKELRPVCNYQIASCCGSRDVDANGFVRSTRKALGFVA
jgi:hypothetical protein